MLLVATFADLYVDCAVLLEHRGGAERDRTDDLRLAKPALSQLSYSPVEPSNGS
jgi:hypothetical protein